MRYALLVNPYAGSTTLQEKQKVLKPVVDMLNCSVYGYDLPTDIAHVAREISKDCDTLVVAGGDTTFAKVMNAVPQNTVLAYIPLGTGNALRYALYGRKSLDAIAHQIKEGKNRNLDCIIYREEKALIASIGVDADAVRLSEHYRSSAEHPLFAYGKAGVYALSKRKRTSVTLTIDGRPYNFSSVFSLLVMKHPWYAFGLHINPRVIQDDRAIHALVIEGGVISWGKSFVQSLTKQGNRQGRFYQGKRIRIQTQKKVNLQMDGSFKKEGNDFSFTILPQGITIKC